jgi:hypothetical protein
MNAPKFWHLTEEQKGSSLPLREDAWFKAFQVPLLRILETGEGRDLFNIARDFPRIERIAPNAVTARLTPKTRVSDIRVGAKWGNIIRYRWDDYLKLAERIEERRWFELQRESRALGVPVIAGGTTSTLYPDPHAESATVDGQVGREGVTEDFATLRAGAGNSADDTGTAMSTQMRSHGSSSPNFIQFYRCLALFDATVIGTDNKDSATFSVVFESGNVVDGYSGGFSLGSSDPDSNTAIVSADYAVANFGGTAFATALATSGITADGSTYNDMAMNAAGLSFISAGIVKLGMRQQHDFEDSAPTWSGGAINQANPNTADVTGTSEDPKLVIVHTSPGGPSNANLIMSQSSLLLGIP